MRCWQRNLWEVWGEERAREEVGVRQSDPQFRSRRRGMAKSRPDSALPYLNSLHCASSKTHTPSIKLTFTHRDTFAHTVYKPAVQNTQAEMHCKKKKKKRIVHMLKANLFFCFSSPLWSLLWWALTLQHPHGEVLFFLWVGGYYRRGRGLWLNEQREKDTENRVKDQREKNARSILPSVIKKTCWKSILFYDYFSVICRDSLCLRLPHRLHASAALFVEKLPSEWYWGSFRPRVICCGRVCGCGLILLLFNTLTIKPHRKTAA